METLNTVRINQMSHIACDGTKIGFRMHWADRTHKDMHMAVGDAPKFIALLVQSLQRAAPEVPPGVPPLLTLYPIEARSVGLGADPRDGRQTIALDLGLFQMTYVLPPGHHLQPAPTSSP